jgi:hypothetical protein
VQFSLQSHANIRKCWHALVFWLIAAAEYSNVCLSSVAPQPTLFGLQSPGPERVVNPLIQECLNAVTEHQRLWALMKGEWVKGLLPMSSMRPDLTVQRIRGKHFLIL